MEKLRHGNAADARGNQGEIQELK